MRTTQSRMRRMRTNSQENALDGNGCGRTRSMFLTLRQAGFDELGEVGGLLDEVVVAVDC